MSDLDDTQKSSNLKSQNSNTSFSAMGIKSQDSFTIDSPPKVQNKSITDEDIFEESLTPEIENILNSIDSGKKKLNSYSNIDDYFKHLDRVLK